MKMKKWMVIGALVAAGTFSAQAVSISWADSDGVGNWSAGANWSAGVVPSTPTYSHTLIKTHTTVWPTVDSDVPNVATLGVGWDSAEGELNVVDGAALGAVTLRVGYHSVGTLNVSGGNITAISSLQLGWGDTTGGSGTANLTGTGLLFSLAGTAEWYNGSQMKISDSAIFLITGDHTGENWISTELIVAGEAGKTILSSYDEGTGRTSFIAIPESATLGLFAMVGGGLLFVRRKFQI